MHNVNYVRSIQGLLTKTVNKKNKNIEFVAQGTKHRYLYRVTYLYNDLKIVEVKIKGGKWGIIGFISYGNYTRTTKRWRELLSKQDTRVLAFEYIWKINHLHPTGQVRAYFARRCEECGRFLYKEESIRNHSGLVCTAKKAERNAVQKAAGKRDEWRLVDAPVF